jgi:TRAP-type C4-dicarboxylate transport system permease small subunit
MTDKKIRKPLWIKAINWLSEASGYISGALIMAASLVVLHQVLVRYLFGLPSIWQTEMSIYLLMFASFVGGAYGLKHNAHVGVDLISIKLSPKAQIFLRIVTGALCLGLTVIVAWKGFHMWWEATDKGWRSDTLWGPKLTYPYFILPLGMLLISLQYIVIIYEDITSLKQAKEANAKTDLPSTGHSA